MTEYHGNDFYCDIAVPKKVNLRIEYEDEQVLAYHHTKPFWPLHIVIVPKKHIASFTDRGPGDDHIVAEVLRVVSEIARKVELEMGACRILTNLGRYQDSKHLHFHVASGEPLDKSKRW
jgi:histidine triad (HIT) family protein